MCHATEPLGVDFNIKMSSTFYFGTARALALKLHGLVAVFYIQTSMMVLKIRSLVKLF